MNAVPLYEIKSLPQFVKIICELTNKCRIEGARYQSFDSLIYRGHSRTSYKLIPSIARPIVKGSKGTYLQHEGSIIQECKDKMPEIISSRALPIEVISTLQHFGLPTRLLDVTENALVSLFFSCGIDRDENNEEDGEVICLKNINFGVQHYIVNAIADTYRFIGSSGRSMEEFFEMIRQQTYYIDDKSAFTPLDEKDLLGRLIRERLYSVPRIASAPYNLQRQRAQQGRFIIFPNRVEGSNIVSRIDAIDKENSDSIYARIIVDKRIKRQMIRDLRGLGVTKDSLFPDSGDRIAESIKERYCDFYLEKAELLEA